jgi:hypothetical protein
MAYKRISVLQGGHRMLPNVVEHHVRRMKVNSLTIFPVLASLALADSLNLAFQIV